MANIVKKDNSMILFLSNVFSSFFYTFKEIATNSENEDDVELEKQLRKIRSQENSVYIYNLETKINNEDKKKKKDNKYIVDKKEIKKTMSYKKTPKLKEVEKELDK